MLSFEESVNHVSPIHDSPILFLTSTLNSFDSASLKLQVGGYFYGDDTRQILVKMRKHIKKRSSRKTSEKGVFIRFKVQNKQSPLSLLKLPFPPNPQLTFESLVLMKTLFCFSREIASPVKTLFETLLHVVIYPFKRLNKHENIQEYNSRQFLHYSAA